jgi:hypothetical protein
MTLTLPWGRMTEREQLVWTASYAMHANAPMEAISFANQAVLKLRELDVDNERFSGPEYDAARYGPGLTFAEFRAWYPVAIKIARHGHTAPEDVDEGACHRAYEIYRQCATDFS